jgi:glutathione S-transferase
MMLNIIALVFGRMPDQAPFFIKPIMRAISKKAEQGRFLVCVCNLAFYGPQLKMHLEYIEQELGKSTWFAGEEVTGAGTLSAIRLRIDIMMSFPVQVTLVRADSSGMDLTNMRAFMKRIEERPAYHRAVEKGGPLDVDG